MIDIRLHLENLQSNLIGFEPKTPAGRRWLTNQIQPEPWQWVGPTLWIDARAAEPVVGWAGSNGLEVGE